MLPKHHIFFGAIFSVLIYYLFQITIFQASLIFLASILIDFDHYMWYVKRKKDWSLKNAYKWHKALPKNHKPLMHIFHTIEFLILIRILGFYFSFFIFILIGVLFHSFLDIIDIVYNKKYSYREFSLIRYLLTKDKSIYY